MASRVECRTLKVEDVGRLRALLAEQIEAVEPGLRVLETRPLLGGSTVDLVALDTRASLVLVGVGLVADERMLLRMLDAYSWCLESPEMLARRYRITRLPAGGPPRVVFVAERLPDAFLRHRTSHTAHRVSYINDFPVLWFDPFLRNSLHFFSNKLVIADRRDCSGHHGNEMRFDLIYDV